MRTTLDFSPLFRTGVGFDRVFDVLNSASRVQPVDNWPPYDIIKEGEDNYRIVMAVAGFEQDELMLTDRPNLLIVSGAKKDDPLEEPGVVYLHKGIAAREFERRFELADHVKVAQASLHDGLLSIELRRDIPEALKPRRIEIRNDNASKAKVEPAANVRQIDAPQAA
jgi:molecular chaperone IbpA